MGREESRGRLSNGTQESNSAREQFRRSACQNFGGDRGHSHRTLSGNLCGAVLCKPLDAGLIGLNNADRLAHGCRGGLTGSAPGGLCWRDCGVREEAMPSRNADRALLPAHVMSAEVGAGRLSPVDIVDAALARIGAQDQKLHAFVEVYDKEARLAAEAAEKAIRSGHRVGPLHGIPIALKDLVEIEGRVTTGGSQVWRERRSAYTASLAQRLIAAGLIVIGKTHTVEFAMGGWGTNQHRGTPWNPWDLEVARTPGGSSSGSGVAVAAGFAPWAIGTDTGGSRAPPAPWCGFPRVTTTVGRRRTPRLSSPR